MSGRKLELNKETLRDLTDVDLAEATGGAADAGAAITTSQTPACPSGATWFTDCDSMRITCG